MKRLVSRKRSTQLAIQLSSDRENRVPGVPVMHLSANETTPNTHHSSYALVPAHARVLVNAGLNAGTGLFALDELLKLFLDCVSARQFDTGERTLM